MVAKGFYSRKASKRLQDLMKEAAEGGAKERTNLAEEVDLARANAERALKIFDKTCLDPLTCKKEGITNELRIAAQQNLRDALKFVADMVQSYCKAMASSEDLLNAVQAEHIALQLTLILKEELGEKDPRMPRILDRIENMKAPDKTEARSVTISIS